MDTVTVCDYALDCSKHTLKMDEILRRIENITGICFCRRQDGNCNHPEQPSVAVGTRYLHFYGIPKDRYNEFVRLAEAAKNAVVANVP